MFRFSFRFNCNASLIACITRRCSAQLLFSLLYRFAQCSFLIDRSFPAEICTSPFFSPPFHLSLSHSVNAPGCSLHVVAQTRRLSISIRSSLRLLCNLSTADVVTWSEREPTVGPHSLLAHRELPEPVSCACCGHKWRFGTYHYIILNIFEKRRFVA